MYLQLFFVLVFVCGAVHFLTRQKSADHQRSSSSSSTDGESGSSGRNSPQFAAFQRNYLVVYLIMAAADWLQGPYVYALYKSYGFSKGEIGTLFIAGFGSSLIFGTIVGSLADRFGRKNFCLLYGLLYGLSCCTKHFNSFPILMVGRLLGGIATSILFSSFEAWMINAHNLAGFDPSWISNTFYLAVFGNSIVAILSGLLATAVTEFFGTMVAPFDTSLILLIIGDIIVALTWTENYGTKQAFFDFSSNSFIKGCSALFKDVKVFCLGLAQSLFEAAMYTFVFLWTPTLEAHDEDLPHGLIFASYMVCIMIGSQIFNALTDRGFAVELTLFGVLAASTVTMVVPVIANNSMMMVLGAFLVYECCVGMFWPSVGTLRSKYIPEEVRATITNYFRMPTNAFVLLVLNKIEFLSTETSFALCALVLIVSTGAQFVLSERSMLLYRATAQQQRSV